MIRPRKRRHAASETPRRAAAGPTPVSAVIKNHCHGAISRRRNSPCGSTQPVGTHGPLLQGRGDSPSRTISVIGTSSAAARSYNRSNNRLRRPFSRSISSDRSMSADRASASWVTPRSRRTLNSAPDCLARRRPGSGALGIVLAADWEYCRAPMCTRPARGPVGATRR